MTNQIATILLLSTLLVTGLFGQRVPNSPDPQTDNKKSSFGTVFEGSPGKAALYSLVLPGAGQIYNGRWWKAPIVWAAEGTVAYFLADRIQTYNRWNSCYISLVGGSPNTDCGTLTDVNRVFDIRQSARSNKEMAWVFMSLAHLLNVVEAFIDRHLINFDTSSDLGFYTPENPRSYGATSLEIPTYDFLRLRISLNKN